MAPQPSKNKTHLLSINLCTLNNKSFASLVWPCLFLCQYFWNFWIFFVVVLAEGWSKSKLCKFYSIDKFVKNICKYLAVTDHLLEYWKNFYFIHNNCASANRGNKGINPSSLSTTLFEFHFESCISQGHIYE